MYKGKQSIQSYKLGLIRQKPMPRRGSTFVFFGASKPMSSECLDDLGISKGGFSGSDAGRLVLDSCAADAENCPGDTDISRWRD